jgi:Cysteine-rich secretory protein family
MSVSRTRLFSLADSPKRVNMTALRYVHGIAVFVIAFVACMSPTLAEPAAVVSQGMARDQVAQADFQTKRSKGPIIAPGPVEEYELNKGPLTPGPVEGTELERGPIVATPEPPGAGGAPPDMSDMLKVHNERRARHCVPALTWSPALAQAAQAYAEKCILGKHGSSGENMANWVTINNGEPVLPAKSDREIFEDAWYCEIDNYNFDKPEIVGGFKQNCDPPVNGHFTQIVWRGTQQIGCGRATCTIDGKQGTNWVCRYSPAGNSGPLAENVPPPC